MLHEALALDRPVVVFDTETTGVNPRLDRIVEIACLKVFPDGRREEWTRPEGGLFLWVELPERISAETLFEQALGERVAFVPGTSFFACDAKLNFMRLNFSNQLPEMIDEGIKRIAGVLKRSLA